MIFKTFLALLIFIFVVTAWIACGLSALAEARGYVIVSHLQMFDISPPHYRAALDCAGAALGDLLYGCGILAAAGWVGYRVGDELAHAWRHKD